MSRTRAMSDTGFSSDIMVTSRLAGMQEARSRQSEPDQMGWLPHPRHSDRLQQRFMGTTSDLGSLMNSAIDADGFYTQQRVDAMLQRMHKEQEGGSRDPEPSGQEGHAGIAYLVDRLGGREDAAIVIQRAFRSYLKWRAKQQLQRVLRKCTSVIAEHHVPERFYRGRSRSNFLKSYSIKSVNHVEGVEERIDEEDEAVIEDEAPARNMPGGSRNYREQTAACRVLDFSSPFKQKDDRALLRTGSGRALPPHHRRELYAPDKPTSPMAQDILPAVASAPIPSFLRSPSQKNSSSLPSISSGHTLDHATIQTPAPSERRIRSGLNPLTVSDPGGAESPSAASGLYAWENATRILPALSSPGQHSQDRTSDRVGHASSKPEAMERSSEHAGHLGRSLGYSRTSARPEAACSSPSASSAALLKAELLGRTSSSAASGDALFPATPLSGFGGVHCSGSPRSPQSPSVSSQHDAVLRQGAASSQHQRMAPLSTSPGPMAQEISMAESSAASFFMIPEARSAVACEAAGATSPALRAQPDAEVVGRCHSMPVLDGVPYRGSNSSSPSHAAGGGSSTRQVIHSVPVGTAPSLLRSPAKACWQGPSARQNSPVGSWMGLKHATSNQRPSQGAEAMSPRRSPKQSSPSVASKLFQEWKDQRKLSKAPLVDAEAQGPEEEASSASMDEASKEEESFLQYVQRRMAASGPSKSKGQRYEVRL